MCMRAYTSTFFVLGARVSQSGTKKFSTRSSAWFAMVHARRTMVFFRNNENTRERKRDFELKNKPPGILSKFYFPSKKKTLRIVCLDLLTLFLFSLILVFVCLYSKLMHMVVYVLLFIG